MEYGLGICDILKIFDNEITWFTGEVDYDRGVEKIRERYPIPLILVSMEDLESLTDACHRKGINVCMDFVMNHTSEEHEWAKRARQGDGEYMSRYFFFDSGEIPAQYERTVPQVHTIVRMMRMISEVVCPGVLLLGEVVMEPEKVTPYFGTVEKLECHMLYNVTTMATTWHTVATRDVRLLKTPTSSI